MRSSKIILIVMVVLLTILFSSGCISDESPSTDSVIKLNLNDQFLISVTAKTDNKQATWSVDGVDKETDPGGIVSYTLYYKDFTIGEHILKLTDSDGSVEWKISVSNEQTGGQDAGIISTNNSRGYDRNTPWDERHRIAKQKINGTKEFTIQ